MAIRPDCFWNFKLVSFQVGKTIFRVPIHGLVKPGSAFEAMLSLPNPDLDEGSRNEKPILLEGIEEQHFRALLYTVYGDCGSEHKFSNDFDNWVGVLNLATMWNLSEVSEKATVEIEKLLPDRSLVEKLQLGRKFMVKTWTRDALAGLALEDKLPLEEMTWVSSLSPDWETIAKIFYIQRQLWVLAPIMRCGHCNSSYRMWPGQINHTCNIYAFSIASPVTTKPSNGSRHALELVGKVFGTEVTE